MSEEIRPPQAGAGAWTVIGAGALSVLMSMDNMRNLRSVETKDRVAEALGSSSGRSLGLSEGQVLDAMHVGLLLAGAASAAAVAVGVMALRRERIAPRLLIGLSLLVVLGSIMFDPVMGMVLAAGTALLWSGPARDWFAGRPVRPQRWEQEAVTMSEQHTPGGDAPQQRPTPPASDQSAPQGYAPHQPAGQQPGAHPGQPFGEPAGQPSGQPYQPGHPASPYAPAPSGYAAPPPYAQSHQGRGGPGRRGKAPGSVKAASLVTLILAGLTAGAYALLGLAMMVAGDELLRELERQEQVQDLPLTEQQLIAVIGVATVIFVAWSLIAMVLAVFTWRGHNWARILLIISAAVMTLLGLLALPLSLPHLIAALTVIGLLLTSGARAYAKGGDTRHGYDGSGGGYGPPPGGGNPYAGQSGPYGQPPRADQPPSGEQPPASPPKPPVW